MTLLFPHQKSFWDYAMALGPEDDEIRSVASTMRLQSEGDDSHMSELMTAILQRVGAEINRNNLPQILVLGVLAAA
ncbi:uncharacterized protein LOC121761021 [Salvia splendens]|uniref:uncharacterized protein LOC121761021 n=1 Tax=Salvia splendens TaxID=180675 RepID=UPI001C27AF13|nr:uncharacterized protein LOC121761021 [Salvia splendens]